MKVDMHMHSYHSDGVLNCKQLLQEIQEKKIGLFSLTDHETISGLEEMKEAVKGTGLHYIPGVELASRYENREYHLTIYGYDEKNQNFLNLVEEIGNIRKKYDIDVITFLEPKVSLEDFKTYKDDPYKGGWPSLNFLIVNGLINNISDYFKLTEGCTAKMKFPDPKHIIDIAHQAGAAVFLAHPSSNQKGGLSVARLDYFREAGIDGLECYSPYCCSQEEVDRYVFYCKKHNLKISGGSDYHGGFVNRTLGYPHVTIEEISYDYLRQFIYK